MATLTVTSRGQVTFRREVLKHFGIEPGDRIEMDLLPDKRAVLKQLGRRGPIHSFLGLLAGESQQVATLEELDQAAAEGWPGSDR